MLAFTQSRLDGENQFNIMAQNHVHFNYVAQQQKELLEQQAATIQAGTELVLAAQKRMLETLLLRMDHFRLSHVLSACLTFLQDVVASHKDFIRFV